MKLNHRRIAARLLITTLGAFLSLPALTAEPGTTTAVIPEYAESYPEYGVSESVRAGDFIYIGGIIATDKDGNVIAPNDGLKQAEVVYGRIRTILEAHGATYKNVVSRDDLSHGLGALRRGRGNAQEVLRRRGRCVPVGGRPGSREPRAAGTRDGGADGRVRRAEEIRR